MGKVIPNFKFNMYVFSSVYEAVAKVKIVCLFICTA